MKILNSKHLISITLILSWLWFWAVYATVNYNEFFPNSTTLSQSRNTGWASPVSSSKEIIIPDGTCRKITSTIGTQYYIPTYNQADWDNFRSHLPAGLTIGYCPPTATITASDSIIAMKLGTITLNWSSTNTDYCERTDADHVPYGTWPSWRIATSGTVTTNPIKISPTTFYLRCHGLDGTYATANTSVTITPVNCVGSWSDTSECSKSCWSWVKKQEYSISIPAEHWGTACPNANGDTRWWSTSCNTQLCWPVCVPVYSKNEVHLDTYYQWSSTKNITPMPESGTYGVSYYLYGWVDSVWCSRWTWRIEIYDQDNKLLYNDEYMRASSCSSTATKREGTFTGKPKRVVYRGYGNGIDGNWQWHYHIFFWNLTIMPVIWTDGSSCVTWIPTTTPTCTDGIKNGTEIGVDCGGSCGACPCIPDGSCNAASPACEKTTYWTDNCSNSCSKTGGACACIPDGSCSAATPTCGKTTYWTNNCNWSCSKTGEACPICSSSAWYCDTWTASNGNGATSCNTTSEWDCSNGGTTIRCSKANSACVQSCSWTTPCWTYPSCSAPDCAGTCWGDAIDYNGATAGCGTRPMAGCWAAHYYVSDISAWPHWTRRNARDTWWCDPTIYTFECQDWSWVEISSQFTHTCHN